MPRKRRQTVSDDPLTRRIYEEAGKEEETYWVLEFKELLDRMPPPPGWHRQKRRGRPNKKRRGRREEFGWKPMVLVLLLKARFELAFREMSSHLRANPDLCTRLGLPRAPSHKTIALARKRLPERWLKRLNRELVGDGKKGGRDDPDTGMPVWIQLEVPFKE